jgi:hypothetical protein
MDSIQLQVVLRVFLAHKIVSAVVFRFCNWNYTALWSFCSSSLHKVVGYYIKALHNLMAYRESFYAKNPNFGPYTFKSLSCGRYLVVLHCSCWRVFSPGLACSYFDNIAIVNSICPKTFHGFYFKLYVTSCYSCALNQNCGLIVTLCFFSFVRSLRVMNFWCHQT